MFNKFLGACVAVALAVAMAAPAGAQRPEPIDARQGIEIARAAETNGINGIYVSPYDGNVYAASVGGDEITVHDPNSGQIVDRIGPERGVNGPDDVFITDDGTMYWTEILTGYVGMLKPGEEPVRQFVGQGVNPITMSDDGRLFVNRLFFGSGLYELDSNLVDPPQLLNASLALNSFDFQPGDDQHLYAPSFFTGDMLKIDIDNPGSPQVVASIGAVSSALKFNSLGEAHAVGIAQGLVLKLDLSGANDHEVVLDLVGTIDNIAFNTEDVLFVAAGIDDEIVRVDTNGHTRSITRAGLGTPGDVAVSADGTVWVTELFALRGFTNGKQPTTSFYDVALPPGNGFAGATTVAVDGDDLLITSGFSNSLQLLNPETGAVSLDVRDLFGVTNAVRHEGEIVAAQLVTGSGDASVVKVDGEREVLLDSTMTINSIGVPLFVPLGLASNGDTLYVGDWATGIVWAVNDGVAVPLAAGLQGLEGIAVDGDRLLAIETGRKQLTAIDLATGEQSALIIGLDYSDRVPTGSFPFGTMSGVAVGDGSIYVSDDGVNNVYEFRIG